MRNHLEALMTLIAQVRRRWKLKILLRGLAVCSCALLVLFCASVFIGRYFNFSDPAIWTLRILAIALFAMVLAVYLVLPSLHKVSDLQVARFIEENYPDIQQRLTSVVELGPGADAGFSPFIVRRLIEDALKRCHRANLKELIHGRALASYVAAAAAGFLILLGILSFGPVYVPYGAAKLFASWTRAADQLPFKIHVVPGNATVQRGSDQQIRATFEGFAPERAQIFVREAGTLNWSAEELRSVATGSAFETVLQNLTSDREYFVEADGFKSSAFKLKVEDLPRVIQVDLLYEFPSYTGLPPRRVENQGNISVLRGSRVRVTSKLSQPATAGKLLLNDGSTLVLEPAEPSTMSAAFVVQKSGSYAVQLADQRHEWRVASDEYQIEALEDQLPEVSISRPGRDYRASRIEEVYVEAKATDDLCVLNMDLHYTINGQQKQVRPLYQQGKGTGLKTVISSYTLPLEEMSLKVGDVISYYAQASDGNPEADKQTATSDMFFIEVANFDKAYSQSQQRAPSGSSEGQGTSAGALTKQQKEIIAATWRLIRSQSRIGKSEFSESVRSVALIQGRLREQTAKLSGMIDVRMGALGNSEMAKLAAILKDAGAEMERAEGKLAKQELQPALPFEQGALKKLIEAESLFKEVQIQLARSGSPESQAASNWEDLSELFELEMDRLKNQYETLRQDAVKKRDEIVDEALRKLRELAQRQEQYLERQRRMQAQQGSGSSSAARSEALQRQQELAEQTENLRRKLEQLARENPENRMPDVARRLQQAAEQMKQAQQELRSSQDASASVSGMRALQQLQEAERLMNNAQSGKSEKSLQQLREAVQSLQTDESKIQEEVSRLLDRKEKGGDPRSENAKGRILDRKDLMVEKVDGLESGLDRVSRELGGQQKEASKKLLDARSLMRERRVRDKIVDGKGFVEKGWYDFAKAREENIAKDLKDLADALSQAQSRLNSSGEEKWQRALDRTRDLVDGLESMKNRLEQASTEGRPEGQERDRRQGSDNRQPGQRDNQDGQRGGGQRNQQAGGSESQETANRAQELRNLSVTGGPAPMGANRRDSTPSLLTPEQLRQMQREYEERTKQARDIMPELQGDADLSKELARVLAGMQALNRNDLGVSPQFLAQLQREILAPLRQFEIELSRRIGEIASRDKLHRISDDDIPPAFRKMVDEYFKRVAGKQ